MTRRRATNLMCMAIVPAVVLSLVPNLALAQADDAGGAASGLWALSAVLVVCAACFASGLLISGEGAVWRRGRALRRRIEGQRVPGAITGTDGRVGWINAPMQAEFGVDAARRGIAEFLAGRLAVDEGSIYRLARRAREIGFAFQPVDGPASPPRILTARYDDPGRLVWMLVPPDCQPREDVASDGAPIRRGWFRAGCP